MEIARIGLVGLAFLGLFPRHLAAQTPIYRLPIYTGTQAVAAITVGDFDPLHAGNELACLMADGSLVELALGASGWTASTIFRYTGSSVGPWNPTMRVSLNVGDVLLEHAGREIVVSFQKQVVAVYYTPAQGWTNQIIRDVAGFADTTWGAEIGDCDRGHPGEEVFSILETVFDFSTGTVYGATNGSWPSNEVYSGEVGMDAAIGDSNPDLAGSEIIVVTEVGPAYEIMPPGDGRPGPWPRRRIWNDPENAGWAVKIGDVEPENPGNELVYGTRYNDRIMLSRHNGTNAHQVQILLTGSNTNEPNSMLDIAIAQVLPASPSAEILGVDMSGSLYVVERRSNQWQGSVLWQDTNALHTVIAADLIPTISGDEIVVAGASGTVTLLCNPSPVLDIALTAQQRAVLAWTALQGLTYTVQTSTNLTSSSWTQVTNLIYQGVFSGTLRYTNAEATPARERFFRVRTSR